MINQLLNKQQSIPFPGATAKDLAQQLLPSLAAPVDPVQESRDEGEADLQLGMPVEGGSAVAIPPVAALEPFHRSPLFRRRVGRRFLHADAALDEVIDAEDHLALDGVGMKGSTSGFGEKTNAVEKAAVGHRRGEDGHACDELDEWMS